MKSYYVVHKGLKTGIFKSFAEIKPLVINYSGAKYKSFGSLNEAEKYLLNGPGGENTSCNLSQAAQMTQMAQMAQKSPKIISKDITKSVPMGKKVSSKDIIKSAQMAQMAQKSAQKSPQKSPKISPKLNNLIEEYLNKLNTNKLYIYTDGSVKGNGKKNATGGYGVFFSDINIPYISKIMDNKQQQITTPLAEMNAIIDGLKAVLSYNSTINGAEFKPNIELYTDSEYCYNCLTKWHKTWAKNNWIKSDKSEVKNKDEIIVALDLIDKTGAKLIHINSHTGKKDLHSIGNDIADLLSKCY